MPCCAVRFTTPVSRLLLPPVLQAELLTTQLSAQGLPATPQRRGGRSLPRCCGRSCPPNAIELSRTTLLPTGAQRMANQELWWWQEPAPWHLDATKMERPIE